MLRVFLFFKETFTAYITLWAHDCHEWCELPAVRCILFVKENLLGYPSHYRRPLIQSNECERMIWRGTCVILIFIDRHWLLSSHTICHYRWRLLIFFSLIRWSLLIAQFQPSLLLVRKHSGSAYLRQGWLYHPLNCFFSTRHSIAPHCYLSEN